MYLNVLFLVRVFTVQCSLCLLTHASKSFRLNITPNNFNCTQNCRQPSIFRVCLLSRRVYVGLLEMSFEREHGVGSGRHSYEMKRTKVYFLLKFSNIWTYLHKITIKPELNFSKLAQTILHAITCVYPIFWTPRYLVHFDNIGIANFVWPRDGNGTKAPTLAQASIHKISNINGTIRFIHGKPVIKSVL